WLPSYSSPVVRAIENQLFSTLPFRSVLTSTGPGFWPVPSKASIEKNLMTSRLPSGTIKLPPPEYDPSTKAKSAPDWNADRPGSSALVTATGIVESSFTVLAEGSIPTLVPLQRHIPRPRLLGADRAADLEVWRVSHDHGPTHMEVPVRVDVGLLGVVGGV